MRHTDEDVTRAGRRPVLVRATAALLVLGAGFLSGCSVLERGGEAAPEGTASGRTELEGSAPAPGADTVTYELHGGDADPVTVAVEVAATPEERQVGLSNRESVPEGTGMVFLFPEDTDSSFWMKDTLVPLSIAYVAADGTVVSVHAMTPCEADPCPVYDPHGPYRYALELPAGGFDAAGVGPGDRVVPADGTALPDPS